MIQPQPIERTQASAPEPALKDHPHKQASREIEDGRNGAEPHSRAVGAPLPVGRRSPDSEPARGSAPPGRSLAAQSQPDDPSGMQRAMGILKQALPFVQRLLPLIDGNVFGAVANLVAARPHTPPPPPKVDLAPLENRVANLHMQQQELRGQLMEQNTSLRRVEGQLEMVREATDRNTLEQQELIEDLRTMGQKVNLIAWLLVALLAVSVLLNLALFLHIKRVLP